MFAVLLALTTPASATDLIWTGIDFGEVRMVGTMDFRDPDEIFPDYLQKWNGLFTGELVPLLEKRLKVDAFVETEHLSAIHEATDSAAQIVRDDGISTGKMYVEKDALAARVKSYELRHTDGLALTFVADQLNKPAQEGCYWVTFYDVATREVKHATRRCGAARGFGFRNYWFGTIKDVLGDLKKKDLPGG